MPLSRSLFAYGQAEGARGVVLHKRLTTPQYAKSGPALRVEPETAPLGVARRSLRTTQLTPRAWIGAVSGSTAAYYETSTGPSDPRVNIQKGSDGNAKAFQVKQVLAAIDKLESMQ